MRILHTVENYYPSVGGSQEVVRQISERLAALGHDVTVATSRIKERKSTKHNGVNIVEFDVAGKGAVGYSGADIKKYKDFLVQSKFDVIMNYAAQQWASDLAFEVIDSLKQPKVFVPCGFSGLYQPEYADYFESMPDVLKKYDATVYLSNDYRDINFAKQHKIKNTHLIPNGAGDDEFSQDIGFSIRKTLSIPESDFLILNVGSHTGLKGHAESIEIFQKAKIRNATLLIIGNDFGGGCAEACRLSTRAKRRVPLDWRWHKTILVKELPRIQTVAAYKSANLFLFPSNIEASPLVLFEAMASKTPFLTTDVGNAREIIKWSQSGELLPTQKDASGYSHADIRKSADILERIYINPKRTSKMAELGYKVWKKRFTWEIITKQYENLYERLIA